MNDLLAFITWDVNPSIIESPVAIRYYGLLWATSFIIGLWLMRKMMDKDGAPEVFTDKVFIYVMIGAVVGARLGHVFFYDWDSYKNNLVDILKIWEGGLASHGGLIGVVIAIFLYSKKVTKKSFLWSGDKIVVTVALAACLIRVGNLMNSEIIGKESDSNVAMFFENPAKDRIIRYIDNISGGNYSVSSIDIEEIGSNTKRPIGEVNISLLSNALIDQNYLTKVMNATKNAINDNFDQQEHHIHYLPGKTDYNKANGNSAKVSFEVEMIPRIPTQLLEALSYLIIFIVLYIGYWKFDWSRKEGVLFGLFLLLLFGARFIIENFKEHQTLDADSTLNMGQILSVIPVVAGLVLLIRGMKMNVDTKVPQHIIDLYPENDKKKK